MKKFSIAVLVSVLVILGGLASISTVSASSQTSMSGDVSTATVPASILQQQPQPGEQPNSLQVNDLSSLLPGSYSSQTTLSALNGISVGGGMILVVGGSTNYGNTWTPLIGEYNLNTGQFSDLTSQFVNTLSASSWYLSSAAWNGHSFLIVGVQYATASGVSPAMALYTPQPGSGLGHGQSSGTFVDLSSYIPSSDSSWLLSGVVWSGGTFMIVGYAPLASSLTGVRPVMASFTLPGGPGPSPGPGPGQNSGTFTDLSVNIPEQYGSDYFLGITNAAPGQYLITGWEGSKLYPESAGLLLLYSPHSGAFTDLSALIPSNVYWLGGAAPLPGNEFIVVGVTYPDTPAVGLLNLNAQTYTDFTPPSTNLFPSTYYLLNSVAAGMGNTFYVVGQSQQFNNNDGSSAVFGSITPYGLYVNDLTSVLPSSYFTETGYSGSLTGVALAGNQLFVTGGFTNYGNVWGPFVGVYNIQTNVFTDLTSEFITDLSASTWFPSAVASDGHSFLIVGTQYTASGVGPAMALYTPQPGPVQNGGTFVDLNSYIPPADSNWWLSGVTYSRGVFMIVGYEYTGSPPPATGVESVMASFTLHGGPGPGPGPGPNSGTFTDLSVNIPEQYSTGAFQDITTIGNQYLITGWDAEYSGTQSDGQLFLYSPFSGSFTNLSYLLPANVFWTSGAVQYGNNILVVGVTGVDAPAMGILNLQTQSYADLTPPGTNPFPSSYYWLAKAVWSGGQTFYVVGISQPNSEGTETPVLGSVTLSYP
jgi:hypothetical protein